MTLRELVRTSAYHAASPEEKAKKILEVSPEFASLGVQDQLSLMAGIDAMKDRLVAPAPRPIQMSNKSSASAGWNQFAGHTNNTIANVMDMLNLPMRAMGIKDPSPIAENLRRQGELLLAGPQMGDTDNPGPLAATEMGLGGILASALGGLGGLPAMTMGAGASAAHNGIPSILAAMGMTAVGGKIGGKILSKLAKKTGWNTEKIQKAIVEQAVAAPPPVAPPVASVFNVPGRMPLPSPSGIDNFLRAQSQLGSLADTLPAKALGISKYQKDLIDKLGVNAAMLPSGIAKAQSVTRPSPGLPEVLWKALQKASPYIRPQTGPPTL